MSEHALIDRARELAVVLRERAASTEALRRIPDETAKALVETGLVRALQPARFGGGEQDPRAFLGAVVEVAAGCASTGWVLGVLGVHAWQLALFDPRAQDEVWGEDPTALASSSYAPTGSVESADGGFRLNGRWSFSSGCDLCDWVLVGGLAPVSEGVDLRTFLLPRSDYEIDDNWHVAGLCGTGSKDIVVEDSFVPAHRTLAFGDIFAARCPGYAVNTAPVYRIPFTGLFAYAIAAPAIGAARAAAACYREQVRVRRDSIDLSKKAEDPLALGRLARATAAADAASLRLERDFDEMMRLARSGAVPARDLRARYRWDAANAVGTCVRAVDELFEASGGHAIFLDQPIQRVFRDVHAMRAHAINDPDKASAIFARSELGVPGPEPFV